MILCDSLTYSSASSRSNLQEPGIRRSLQDVRTWRLPNFLSLDGHVGLTKREWVDVRLLQVC